MAEYVTQKELKTALQTQTDEVVGVIHTFMKQVDGRLHNIESKQLEHDEQFRKQNKNYDHLVNTIDGFLSRIDGYETEQLARDRQFERLVDWAHKVSAKTGIPLENL